MATATVTSKGQITIPAEVRLALGLDVGDRVEFVEMNQGQFAMVAASIPLQKLKGIVKKPSEPVTIEEMNAAIAQRGSQTNLQKK